MGAWCNNHSTTQGARGMRGKLQFIGMATFLVLVLAGIAFFISQEGIAPPDSQSSTSERSKVAKSTQSVTPERDRASVVSDTEDLSTPPAEEVPESQNEAPEKEAPATKAKRPRGPGVVKGVVTWHGDGTPVSGAEIHLDYVNRPHGYDPYPDERMAWTARTDTRGEFRVSNLPVNNVGAFDGQLTVIASKDGASAVTSVGLTDDETQTIVELVLRPSGGIAGQVVDETGAPVKGAIVMPREMSDKAQQQYAYGARSLWTASAEDGRFQLDNLNEGGWTLAVHAEHYADVVTKSFNTGETNAKIVLEKGSSVSGKVIEAKTGEPMEGVFVTVNAQDHSGTQLRGGTDKEGLFHVDALADGDYQIFLDDDTRVLVGEAPKFSIAKAALVEGIVLTAADGGTISGMVTDAETGEPINGIRITAQGNQTASNRPLQGISDETGFYEITGVPGGSYTMRRRWKEGYRHGESRENKSVTLALGEVLENVDFAVPRGLSMSGIVVDEAGDPVQGVTVYCKPVVDNDEGEDVRTTEDGTFTVRGFSPNIDVNIQVNGRGYTAPRVGPLSTGEAGMTDIKIVVAAGASVSGIVVDMAGKPLAEMYVTASSPDGGFGAMEVTGPGGEFQIKSLAEGTYRLEARRQNSWSNRQENKQEITVAQGEKVTDVRIVFDGTPGVTISGKITNSKREPIKEASINAYSPTGGSSAYIQSDAEGNYELSVDEGGTYHMNVYHQNYTGQERDGVEAGTRNMDFTLEGRGTVEGRVLDATTGKPIPNFEIANTRGNTPMANYQMSNYKAFYNEDGLFSITDVEADEATVYARATGYGPAAQSVGVVRAGEVTGGIVFRLKSGASIEGIVRDTTGAPVQSAQIFLLDRVEPWMVNQNYGGGNGPAGTSDADGHFEITSLGEDLTKITAVHPDYPNTTIDVALTPGNTLHVEIVMTGGGTVDGIVSINGVPAPNQQVYAHGMNGSGYQNATTDKNGYYTLSKLPPGDIMVGTNINRDGVNRSMNKPAAVEGGATTTVDFDVSLGTGAFQGHIRAGGQPIAGGIVLAMLLGGEEIGQQQMQGQISSDGSYLIEGLSGGTYKLMVHAEVPGSGQRRTRTVDANLDEGQTATLDIDLDDGAHVRGTVSGISNANMCQVIAISGALQITNLATDFITPELQARVGGYSPVDASGNYEVTGLQAGDYTIVAFQMGQNGFEGATFATGQVNVGESGAVELNLSLR